MKKLIIILFFLIFSSGLKAQKEDTLDITFGIIEGNDTIIHKELDAVDIFPDRKFASKRQERRYSRLAEKIKKVYPLAVEAAELLKEYEPKYRALEKQSDRRKMMKNLEKELLAKHKEELKKWSISDGRILLKLIDRETERTAYSLIQDFRGDASAVFWQGVALIFKNNLKDDYDPQEEDWMIEEIVTLIERGYL